MTVTVATNIPLPDRNRLFAFILEFGGQVRPDLTADTTHLVTLQPNGEKYSYVAKYGQAMGIVALLPHYFDDLMKLRKRMSEDVYRFPDPLLIRVDPVDQLNAAPRKTHQPIIPQTPPRVKALQGLTFFIEHGVEVSRRELIRLTELGADATAENNAAVDCVIAANRGKVYKDAVEQDKSAGSVEWLRSMVVGETWLDPESHASFAPPPTPQQITPKIRDIKATITNYTGKARDDIRRLLIAMGANYVPHLTASADLLISCFPSGQKVVKAREWNVTVVNHLWVEQTYLKMQYQAPTRPEFITYCHNLPEMVDKTRYSSLQLIADASKAQTALIETQLQENQPDENEVIREALLQRVAREQEAHARDVQVVAQAASEVGKTVAKEMSRTIQPVLERMEKIGENIEELRNTRINSVKRISTDHAKPDTPPPHPFNPEDNKRKRVSTPTRVSKHARRHTPLRTEKSSRLGNFILCFTGTKASPEEERVIAKMPFTKIVQKVQMDTTHVICKRDWFSSKFYAGIIFGALIVEIDWMYDSLRAGKWLDEDPYHVREIIYKGNHYDVQESLSLARHRGPVLSGISVGFLPSAESIDVMKPMAETAECVIIRTSSRLAADLSPDTLVFGSKQDVQSWPEHIRLYDTSLMVEIILRQEITKEILQHHSLNGKVLDEHVPRKVHQ
jgi:hypothetical protein